MDTAHATEALEDAELYRTIVEHRKMFNTMKGTDYTGHSPATIDFIPLALMLEAWANDYKEMRGSMIYGEAPEFDELISRLTDLRERFRNITWQ